MAIDVNAGKPADPLHLANIPRLIASYYTRKPNPGVKEQEVAFGTSGHRGSSLKSSFNEDHILAITASICRYRKEQGVTGPLFLAMDTHALSEPAFITALEVLAAHEVDTMLDLDDGYTPTPALSRAILDYNRGRKDGEADGIVITPSHNPPEDGGFKYNPPNGGPADTGATKWIENNANALLREGTGRIPRVTYERALRAATTHRYDYISNYVNALGAVIDMETVAAARLNLAVDPLGGAGIAVLAAHCRALRSAADHRQSGSRSYVPLHAPRLGRQDSHGLLVSLRHGVADRSQRQVRRCVRLRYGS